MTDPGNSDGCPSDGCYGYELMNNIDLLNFLDAKSGEYKNTEIDTRPVTVAGITHNVIDENKDTSWVPIGAAGTGNAFIGTFEGNGYTIKNLWVNSTLSSVGLFGVVGEVRKIVNIRNVGVIFGSIFSSAESSSSGGLVGRVIGDLVIVNSYSSSSGGVFSILNSSSGGLVGSNVGVHSLVIVNSYFSGPGSISSSGVSSSRRSGRSV